MTFDEYQTEVARTDRVDDPTDARLTRCALGLAGEVGEVVEPIKKHLFHGRPLDREAMQRELGDVLWYLTACAAALGLRLEDVAEANAAKLRERYPEGFTLEAARVAAEASR